MQRSRDRRERIAAHLKAVGLPFELVEAVDGRSLDAARLKGLVTNGYSRSLGSELPLGYVGSALSHHKALSIIRQRGYPMALVLEDDAVLHRDFRARVSLALAETEGFDMLKLSGPIGRPQLGRTVTCLSDGGRVVQFELPSHLTTGYLITPQGADKLAPHLCPVRDIFDLELQRTWAHRLAVHELLPYPIQPSGSASTVAPAGDDRSFRRTLRRLPYRVERSIGRRLFLATAFGWRALFKDHLEKITPAVLGA